MKVVQIQGINYRYQNLVKGDIITGYHEGLHEVVSLTNREGFEPLVVYKTIATNSFVKVHSSELKSCSIFHCMKQNRESLQKIINDKRKALDTEEVAMNELCINLWQMN